MLTTITRSFLTHSRACATFAGSALFGGLLPTAALAHHPLGGMPMETFAHGVLSGIGHPLLGFDHLFFVIIVGIAALYTGRALLAPAAYIAAMLVGCFLMASGIGLPMKELVIGLSLLVVGGIVLSGQALGLTTALVLFAAFGLFHGSAFGDSIATQEAAAGMPVLIGYLLGLGVLQYAIAIGAGWVAKTILKATEAQAVQARLAGAVVAGVGLYLTLENVEGLVLGALGWSA
ncbi:MAG: HupE/UreJ family protein [Hyphomicrobiaceae bacterium]|nr:HupE/UreJ family protein [Hyphomicrobiaceae bacterium]